MTPRLLNEAMLHDIVLLNENSNREKISKWLEKVKAILQSEKKKTAEMFSTYYDYTKGNATPDKMEKANSQFRNLLKIAGLASLSILPGSVITIPVVVKIAKKYNINILPDISNESFVLEASYQGNIGAMEMFKFYSVASDEQKDELKQLIDAGEKQKAWALIQQVTGVKLQGSEFNESSFDGNFSVTEMLRFYQVAEDSEKDELAELFSNEMHAEAWTLIKTVNRSSPTIPVSEASYQGNIGAMEMFKFYSVASDEQKDELKQLIDAGEKQKAWALIQQVTGVKLQGSEFNESYVDEDWRKYAVAAGMGAVAASSGTAMYDKMTSTGKVDTSHTVQSTIKKPEIPQTLTVKKTSDVELAKNSSSQDAISLYGNKNENILIAAAISQGIKGVELAAFLAQCAHETGGYVHLVELGDDKYFDKYDAVLKKQGSKTVNVNPKAVELGNNQPGDGPRFKGRGFIQITGRANYRAAGEELGIPLEKKPKLAERPDVAADIAVWYWKTKVRPRVTNFSNVKAVTLPINGGKKGIESRAEKFDKYLTKVKSVFPKLKESASDGATSAGNIATVVSPHISPGSARGKKSYIGSPGKSGTKSPPQVKPKMQKPTDNALDMNVSLFGGVIKR